MYLTATVKHIQPLFNEPSLTKADAKIQKLLSLTSIVENFFSTTPRRFLIAGANINDLSECFNVLSFSGNGKIFL